MDKDYWTRWHGEGRSSAQSSTKNAKQFEVAGEMLTFVQPSVDAKLRLCRSHAVRVREHGTRLRKPDL